MKPFDGRVVMITGCGSGIGRATAQIFAERGAGIVVHDINEAGARQTLELVRGKGARAEMWIGDVASPSTMQKIVAEAEHAFGKIDILVNNAGIASERCPLEEVTEAI